MDKNIGKAEAMTGQEKAGVIDKGRVIFRALCNTLVENWQSGIAGKIFLVASALILAWLVSPLFNDDGAGSSAVQTFIFSHRHVKRTDSCFHRTVSDVGIRDR